MPRTMVSANWRFVSGTTNWSDDFVVPKRLPYDVIIGVETISEKTLLKPNTMFIQHLVLTNG